MTIKKDALIDILKENIVQISFTKKDGTTRDMKCTLKGDMIVPYERKSEVTRKQNDNNISVFDLEKNEWRSFRFDALISYEVSK